MNMAWNKRLAAAISLPQSEVLTCDGGDSSSSSTSSSSDSETPSSALVPVIGGPRAAVVHLRRPSAIELTPVCRTTAFSPRADVSRGVGITACARSA